MRRGGGKTKREDGHTLPLTDATPGLLLEGPSPQSLLPLTAGRGQGGGVAPG